MMRFRWKASMHPDSNVLHVDRRLPAANVDVDHGVGGIGDDEDAAFFAEMLSIPGVVGIITCDYRCQIQKAELFGWEEIRPEVIEMFRRRFAPNGTMVEVPA